VEFSDVSRKHHCRLCGGIFADRACSKRALVPTEMVCRHPNPKLGGHNLHDPQRLCVQWSFAPHLLLTSVIFQMRALLQLPAAAARGARCAHNTLTSRSNYFF
jgi:hypothetical protein